MSDDADCQRCRGGGCEWCANSGKRHDAAAPEVSRPQWRCFYCDEVFTTPGAARDHFGCEPFADAGCQIKAGEERGLLMALRKAEAELVRYRAEDSDADRRYHALVADHGSALLAAEETGYNKGVRDGRKYPVDLDRAPHVPARVVWPDGCLHPNSCQRHRACMYVGCAYQGTALPVTA